MWKKRGTVKVIARKLAPEEQYLSRRNMAVAFEGEFDFPEEMEKAKTEKADPHADHWGAFPEGETAPAASLVMNKFDVRFDGNIVKMGGVGGVATLPAYRRGGAIRHCMRASFRDLYDSGFLLSALYPFNAAFYRQFGFENGGLAHLWTIALSDLNLPDVGGRVRQLFPGDDFSPLLQIYDSFYKNVNLSVVRKEYDPELQKANFLSQKRSIFVWEDEAGEPGAFLIGSRDGEVLDCRTDFSRKNGLLFRDARALRGLLRFVRTAFLANFQAIRFAIPAFVDLLALIPEAGNFQECGLLVNGMLRVINVEQALKLCHCKGKGELTVQVEDPLLPENCGSFRLCFEPGKENHVEKTDRTPDISLRIGDFSALLCGVKSAEDLPWMPNVEVKNPEAHFGEVFYRKPCHVLDLF